jgi:hypothetical protein
MPSLPPGNLYVLVKELHDLHARAGWPSTREMAKGQEFSHATVHALFTKTAGEAPSLPVLLAVVEVLSRMSGRGSVESTLDKFDRLWRAAYDTPYVNEYDSRESSAAIDLGNPETIQISFTHPLDSASVLTATVSLDMPAALIIERLIEAEFLKAISWRGSYALVDTGSGRVIRENETLRMAKVSNRATLNITMAATGA